MSAAASPAAVAAPVPGARTDLRSGPVLAVTCLAGFMAFLDLTVVNVAFPSVARSFPHASIGALSWVINAYSILLAALLLALGRLGDVAGRRRVFLLGTATFTAASAVCAVAPSVGVLVAARLVQGAAAAAMIPTGFAMLLPEFPPERRATAVGLWSAAAGLASAAGPAHGGVLVNAANWRLAFVINLPIGLATLALGVRALRPDGPRAERRLPDLAGTGLLAAGTGLVVLAITQGHDWGWTAASTLAALLGGAAVTAWALARSRAHPAPAIDTSLWRSRRFALANLGSLLYGVGLYAFLLNGVLFLTGVWRYSILDAGLAVTPGAILGALVAPVAGRVADRHGERAILVPGALLFAAVTFVLVPALGTHPQFLTVWLPTGCLSGVAIVCVATGLGGAAAKAVAPQRLGAGIALNMTARQAGGALGVAILVALLAGTGDRLAAFHAGYALSGAAAVAIAAVSLGLRPQRRDSA